MVHKYSKLAIVVGLKKIGKFDAVKKWIQDNGIYDEWLSAQWVSSNYDGFDEIVGRIADECGIDRTVLDSILEEAERQWLGE